eukprot:GEMP01028158.1.p1 GENE.GEMP01028158.1~~GEMP01028158.1.p1  ORF type:complete len:278 (+),score=65.35 GEMP01028158.1:496-1329(+)
MASVFVEPPVESYGIGPPPSSFPREMSIQDMEYLLSEKDAIIAALQKEIEVIENSPTLNLQSRIQRLEEVLYPLAQGGKLNVTSKALWQIYLGLSEAKEATKAKEMESWKMMDAADTVDAQQEVLEGSRHFQRSSTMLQAPEGQPYLLELTKPKEEAISDNSHRQSLVQNPDHSGPAAGPYFRDLGYSDGPGIQSFVARKSNPRTPAQHWDTLRGQVRSKQFHAMYDPQPANIRTAHHWDALRQQVLAKKFQINSDPQLANANRTGTAVSNFWEALA